MARETFDVPGFARDRPISRSTIPPSTMPGWSDGAWLVLVLSVPEAGDYRARALRLRYRVGNEEFATEQPAALEVCADAVVSAAGEACPWLFAPSPARWAHQSRPA